jgi:hypothetical protein
MTRLTRMIAALALVAPLAAWRAPQVRACQSCLEDKIAATYDWEVAAAAAKRGHTIVFMALKGPVNPNDSKRADAIERRVAAVKGVDAGTVRVSLSPPAASFACDARGDTPRRLAAAASTALAAESLTAEVVRVGAPGGAPAAPLASRAAH